MSNNDNVILCPHCNGAAAEEGNPACAYCGREGMIAVQSPPFTGKVAKVHKAPTVPVNNMQGPVPPPADHNTFAKPQWGADGNVIAPKPSGMIATPEVLDPQLPLLTTTERKDLLDVVDAVLPGVVAAAALATPPTAPKPDSESHGKPADGDTTGGGKDGVK